MSITGIDRCTGVALPVVSNGYALVKITEEKPHFIELSQFGAHFLSGENIQESWIQIRSYKTKA